ncbi:YbjQ family protein [Natronospora cellulosivora (SeqCode)]
MILKIKIVNSNEIAGHEIVETLGLVRGSTIRAKNVGQDILAGLRNIVGGEVKEYTKMINEAREQSIARMISEAESLGADAVINIRFTTSQVMQGASEILVYGTAVKLK